MEETSTMPRLIVAILICVPLCCGSALPQQNKTADFTYKEPVKPKDYSAKQQELLRATKAEWESTMYHRVELTSLQTAWFKALGEPAANNSSEKLGSYTAQGSSQCYGPVLTRKEYRQLTREERRRFHNALNQMKSSIPDRASSLSEYDIFVRIHRGAEAPGSHFGAAFLPWHREFLWRFESALRMHDCCVSIPYWDTTLDQCMPRPADSALWTADYLGNNDGYVAIGDFARWSVLPECQAVGQCLRRDALQGTCYRYIYDGGYAPYLSALEAAQTANPTSETPPCQYLFSDDDITYVMNKLTFADISIERDAKFETDHSLVHAFIGGHAAHIECAASDPVYWLLHAYVDKVWEDFRRKSQMSPRETEYPCENCGGAAHAPYAPMRPFFPLYNIHGLSNHYTNYYYTYQRSPYKCTADEHCGSEILWCDTSSCRCRAKIRLGGDCTGLPANACAGTCTNGVHPVCASAGSCQVCTCPVVQTTTTPYPYRPTQVPYATNTPYPMYPWYRYSNAYMNSYNKK